MPSFVAEVVPSAARVATGSITIDLLRGQANAGIEAGRFFMDVTAASGTTPTLDVDVVELLPEGRERVLGSFAQITVVGTRELAVTDVPFTASLRIDFTIGGTTPSFTFSVDAFVTA